MEQHLGAYIRECRAKLGLTVREFGTLINASGSYINQVEKEQKSLSKKKLFEVLLFFNEERKDLKIILPTEDMLRLYASNKNISYESLYNEFKELRAKIISKYKEIDSLKAMGLAEYDKDGNIKELNRPYYNLLWLLTQKDNDLVIYDEIEHDREFIEQYSIVLTDEEKLKLLKYVEAIPVMRDFENYERTDTKED